VSDYGNVRIVYWPNYFHSKFSHALVL